MAILQKSITFFEVLNSITNQLADQKYDSNTPFTFIDFLKYAKSTSSSIIDLNQYTLYLKNWQSINTAANSVAVSDIKLQFLNLLTDIKINYTTPEEKRFISNLDINNEENLEIIIPFFARKIKDICLYFAEKRKTFNKDLRYISQKGNTGCISEVVKDTIVSLFTTEDNTNNITSSKPLSSLISDVVIEVERQYDVFNDYYDLDPSKQPQFYNATGSRANYFTSNTNKIESEYFFTEDGAINQLIKEKKITLKEIANLEINILSTDLNYLDNTDTIDYTSPTPTNLRYLLNKQLDQAYMGTDFYYVSSNTSGAVVSGSLFNTTSPHRNLLNIQHPSTLTVESGFNKSEREIGLYFKPVYQGVVKMDSKFGFSIDYTKVEKNKVYVFPDPSKYAGISGLTNTIPSYPIVYTLDDKSISRNISTSFGTNTPKTSNRSQTFTSYTSIEQKSYTPSYDGKFQGIEQIVDKGDIYSTETDIFGNIFVSFVDDDYLDRNAKGNFVGGTPSSDNFTDTPTTYNHINVGQKSNISLNQFEAKQYYVIDILTQVATPLSAAFSNIFNKFTSTQRTVDQLNNNIIDIAIFSNVFFIKTPNFVIIDTFTYDGTFNSTGNVPVIIEYNSSAPVGANISAVTTPFKVGNYLYYIVLETRGQANNKHVIHSIYKYNLTTFTKDVVLDLTTNNESTFNDLFSFQNISTNIVMIRQSNLIYNSKSNMFCVVTNYVDLNLMPLFHLLMFRISNNKLQVTLNKYLNPMNYNITQNFYTGNVLSSNFLTQTIVSTPQQSTPNGSISF